MFKNNGIKGSSSLSGGREVYVDFTYCPPGIANETQCETFNRNNKNSTYVFSHNTFVANTASLVTVAPYTITVLSPENKNSGSRNWWRIDLLH